MPNGNEVTVGVFKFDRSTVNTHRFQRTTENGRIETQYVQKALMGDTAPDQIEVVIRW